MPGTAPGHDESIGFARGVTRGAAAISLETGVDHRRVGRDLRRARAAACGRRRDRRRHRAAERQALYARRRKRAHQGLSRRRAEAAGAEGCRGEDRKHARPDRPRSVRCRHVCAVQHPQHRPRRLPPHHGAQCGRRDQRRRHGAALDARAEVGPHCHHGIVVRLCGLAGERQLWGEQGGGDQSRRESQARIGGDRRRRHHHQPRFRRYAAQRRLRSEERSSI